MRKTRLVIQPKRCLHTIGFLLLYLSCPVIGDWGRLQPDTDMAHRAIAIEREGSRTLIKDSPTLMRKTWTGFPTCQTPSWTRALNTKPRNNVLEPKMLRTEDIKIAENRWLDARNQRLSSERRNNRVDVERERIFRRSENLNLRDARREQSFSRRRDNSDRREHEINFSRRLLQARSLETTRREERREDRAVSIDNSRRLLRSRSTDSMNRENRNVIDRQVLPQRSLNEVNTNKNRRETERATSVRHNESRRLLLARRDSTERTERQHRGETGLSPVYTTSSSEKMSERRVIRRLTRSVSSEPSFARDNRRVENERRDLIERTERQHRGETARREIPENRRLLKARSAQVTDRRPADSTSLGRRLEKSASRSRDANNERSVRFIVDRRTEQINEKLSRSNEETGLSPVYTTSSSEKISERRVVRRLTRSVSSEPSFARANRRVENVRRAIERDATQTENENSEKFPVRLEFPENRRTASNSIRRTARSNVAIRRDESASRRLIDMERSQRIPQERRERNDRGSSDRLGRTEQPQSSLHNQNRREEERRVAIPTTRQDSMRRTVSTERRDEPVSDKSNVRDRLSESRNQNIRKFGRQESDNSERRSAQRRGHRESGRSQSRNPTSERRELTRSYSEDLTLMRDVAREERDSRRAENSRRVANRADERRIRGKDLSERRYQRENGLIKNERLGSQLLQDLRTALNDNRNTGRSFNSKGSRRMERIENAKRSSHQLKREELPRSTMETYRMLSEKASNEIRKEREAFLGDKSYPQYPHVKMTEVLGAQEEKFNVRDIAANCILGAVVYYLTSRNVKATN